MNAWKVFLPEGGRQSAVSSGIVAATPAGEEADKCVGCEAGGTRSAARTSSLMMSRRGSSEDDDWVEPA